MDTLTLVAESTGLIETGGQMAGMIAVVALVLIIAGGGIFFALRARNKNGAE